VTQENPPAWHDAAPPPDDLRDYGSRPAGNDGEPSKRGNHDESLGPPILSPGDPMPSAKVLLRKQFFADGHRAIHHWRGSFLEWRNGCYRDADAAAIKASIWSFLNSAHRWNEKYELVRFQPTRNKVADVQAALAAVANLPGHVEAPCWLDDAGGRLPPSELLPVANGLLHLPTGKLIKPSPQFFGLNASSVSFEAAAPEPSEWLAFLSTIWPDDYEAIDVLQDIFGYLLSPDVSQQKIFLIVGPKRSGKGTIARVLTAMLGHDSVAAPTLSSLSMNFGISPLIGKSVAIIGDARLGSKADQQSIAERLLSISGEDVQTIDRKFLGAWTGRLPVRFLLLSNELPRIADASGALASRFIVLTMEQSFFGKEDRGLMNRLLQELPGILNWALEGYRRLVARGHFLQPASAQDAISELEALGSPVGAFVKQCCSVEAGRRCSVAAMFEAWGKWCESNGRKETGTAASFGRDLRAAVPGLKTIQPRGDDGRQFRSYEGIGLTGSEMAWSQDWQ